MASAYLVQPWAFHLSAHGLFLSYLSLWTEEGRPGPKAEKTKARKTCPLSMFHLDHFLQRCKHGFLDCDALQVKQKLAAVYSPAVFW
jgi:hypothetical protein